MSARLAVPVTVVVAVVLFALTGGAVAAGSDAVAVNSVTLSGAGVVADGERPTVAGWRAVNVTTSVTTGTDTYDVCADVHGNTAGTATCRQVDGTNATTNVTLTLDGVPENATGKRDLTVTVRAANATNTSAEPLASGTVGVRVLGAADDVDGDGLGNREEFERGTGFDTRDTDGDGLADGPELNTHETDPTSTDTDDDGLADGVEVDNQQTNPTETDTDGDGLDDGPEVNVHETDPTNPDTDGDGLDDAAEVRRYDTKPTRADTDGDGLADGREVNQLGTNPTRADTDGDGLADAAEDASGGDVSPDDSRLVGALSPTPGVAVGALAGVSLALGAGAVLFYRTRGSPWTDSSGGRTEQVDVEPGVETDGATEGGTGHVARATTDEERVHEVLDEHDGRVRQSVVVSETGWSKSKVSRVLSGMADDGAIQKIPIGRENVVVHPDRVPEGAESPFDSSDE